MFLSRQMNSAMDFFIFFIETSSSSFVPRMSNFRCKNNPSGRERKRFQLRSSALANFSLNTRPPVGSSFHLKKKCILIPLVKQCLTYRLYAFLFNFKNSTIEILNCPLLFHKNNRLLGTLKKVSQGLFRYFPLR